VNARIDFDALDAQLLPRAEQLITSWLPSAKRVGSEVIVGNIQGEPGESLKFSLTKGCWKDFATEEGGPGLVSLYAAIHGIEPLRAARELLDYTQSAIVRPPDVGDARNAPDATEGSRNPDGLVRPPIEAIEKFDATHFKHGKPAHSYVYRDDRGPLFIVSRYELPDRKKQFVPWRWSKRGWQAKAAPIPRPLYNLDRLVANPGCSVLVVEGEKCAEAAQPMFPSTVVTTWPGGANAVQLADLEPLRGRLIAAVWPDADEAGLSAGKYIATRLAAMGCRIDENTPGVKLIDVRGQPDGWDLADAVDDGWTAEDILNWGRAHRVIVKSTDAAAGISKTIGTGARGSIGDGSTLGSNQSLYRIESRPQQEAVPRIWLSQLRTRKDGSIIPDEDNVMTALKLAPELRGLVQYNEFADLVELHRLPPWQTVSETSYPSSWTDDDRVRLQAWFQAQGIEVTKPSTVQDAVVAYAKLSSYHPVRNYLNELRWDGKGRIAGWLGEYLGADGDREYLEAIGPSFLISLVARVMQPGCKADCVLVLEGPQGLRKSAAACILAGEPWFSDSLPNLHSKDAAIQLQGRWIQELPELAAVRFSAVEAVKAFLSRAKDRYRPPYGRNAIDRPRHCVFIGTTNLHEYLQDETGGRRFWPVRCRKLDLEGLARDRDQLLAEAFEGYRNGSVWHLSPKLEDMARQQQELRRQISPQEEQVLEYLDGLLGAYKEKTGTCRGCEVTMRELLQAIRVNIERQGHEAGALAKQFSAVLAREGWEKLKPVGRHPNRRQPYQYIGPER